MREFVMILVLVTVWCSLAFPVVILLGRLFRFSIEGDEQRARALMNRGRKLDITLAVEGARHAR